MSSYEEDIRLAVETKDFVSLENIIESYGFPNRPIHVLFCYAASKGYLDVLQWAVKKGFKLDSFTLYHAIKTGQLHVLEWLKQCTDQSSIHMNQMCENAISHRQWTVLEWARKNNYGWGDFSCCFAASNGDLDILKRARLEGAYWDEKTCMYAAADGHIHVLEWLRSQDSPDGKDPYGRPCPWDETTCRTAAAHGRLDILKWAVANGCPWHPYAFSEAGRNGHIHIVHWILHMKLPWDIEPGADHINTTYVKYNTYQWHRTYSNKARWADAIDINLMECLHCADLEQLIKNYI